MKLLRWLLLLVLLVPLLLAQAQVNEELQVWQIYDRELGVNRVEYRDTAGDVLAYYDINFSGMEYITHQGGGKLAGTFLDYTVVFDPTTGMVTYEMPFGMQPSTGQESYIVSAPVLSSNGGQWAYGVYHQSMGTADNPSDNQIYIATPDMPQPAMLVSEQASSMMTIQPLSFILDDAALLYYDQPTGIGGYILFWTYQNVRVMNLQSTEVTSIGDLDGYTQNATLLALVERGDSGPTGLTVTNWTTGQTATYPLPALSLAELPSVGGGAYFSPDTTKVAYQVARGDPEAEKFWTILVDLTTGQSRVLFEDEGQNYSVNYGQISGWLDNNTLVLGSWEGTSAIIDVNSGTLIREGQGRFMGYAGVTDTSTFAPLNIASAQCPGSPISRLVIGMHGRVTITNGQPVNVRSFPGGDIAGQKPEGSAFTVLDGPTCKDNYAWWRVQFDDDAMQGVVAEGDASQYYLEPWQ